MQSSLVKPKCHYFFIVTSYLLTSAKLYEVELYSNVAAILRRVGGVPALFRKIDINRSAVHISICLNQSEWEICIVWPLPIIVSTLRVCTTNYDRSNVKKCMKWQAVSKSCLLLHFLRQKITFSEKYTDVIKTSHWSTTNANNNRSIVFSVEIGYVCMLCYVVWRQSKLRKRGHWSTTQVI